MKLKIDHGYLTLTAQTPVEAGTLYQLVQEAGDCDPRLPHIPEPHTEDSVRLSIQITPHSVGWLATRPKGMSDEDRKFLLKATDSPEQGRVSTNATERVRG